MKICVLFKTPATLLVILGGVALATVCPAQTLYHEWSEGFGDWGYQAGYSVAADGARNIIVAGVFQGFVDFGGEMLTSAGDHDIFLAKLDPSGNHLWSQCFGDAATQTVWLVKTDGDRNIIITGDFQGSVDFGGGVLTSAGDRDIFLAKFDPSGNHVWSQRFGDGDYQAGHCVVVDDTGNVIITGGFQGSVDFGGEVLTSAGDQDIFLAKFDPSGNHLWSQRFGDPDPQGGRIVTVAADDIGNVIMAGDFHGSVDFGGRLLTSAGGRDIFLAKFDPNGYHLWSQRFGDLANQYCFRVAADYAENVIITGYFSGAVNFGSEPLISSGGATDVYLAKYDPSGNHLWSQRFGDLASEGAHGLTVDGAGYVIIAGFFRGSVDFGGLLLTSAGGQDIFLAKFDPDGNHHCSRGFGDAGHQLPWSVVADGAGNVIITGEFENALDFGGGQLTCVGDQDIFLAKFFCHPVGNNFPEEPDFIEDLPSINALVAVYPNPLNPQTTITFTLGRDGRAEIGVYDLTGRLVNVLADHIYTVGDYSVVWDGKDTGGREAPSGSYIVRLETESCVEAQKISLIR